MNKLGPAGTGDMKLKVPKGNIHYVLFQISCKCLMDYDHRKLLQINVTEGKTGEEETNYHESCLFLDEAAFLAFMHFNSC